MSKAISGPISLSQSTLLSREGKNTIPAQTLKAEGREQEQCWVSDLSAEKTPILRHCQLIDNFSRLFVTIHHPEPVTAQAENVAPPDQ